MHEFDFDEFVNAKLTGGINIDTGWRCRLKCPACIRTQSIGTDRLKSAKDLTMNAWRKMLEIDSASMQLCGQISDPIYHPRFIEMLKIRQEEYPNVKLKIYTNGSGKKDKWWDQVIELSKGLEHKDDWIFGLDGATQEIANIYRVGTNFDNVWSVMERLGKEDTVTTVWQFIVFEHNKHQLEDAYKMAKDINIVFKELWTSRDTIEVPAAKKADTANQDLIFRF